MTVVKISIIVPIYNAAEYLHQCLSSIQNQTFRDIEVIMVNDCSDDNSDDIISEYEHSDSRFISFKNTQIQGPGVSRNFGISKATGKYLLFVDSDDWIDSKTCEVLFTVAEKYDLEVLIGNYTLVYKRKKMPDVEYKLQSPVIYSTGKELIKNSEIFTAVWDKLWLKDFVVSNNLQNDTDHFFEDTPFVIDGLNLCKNASIIDFPFYYYYQGNTNSITKSVPTKKHLEDRDWVMKYLSKRIIENRNTIIEKPIKTILAKQIQPALANLRNYIGNNKVLKTSLLKVIISSVKLTKSEFLKIETIPLLKKVLIIISPTFYNYGFKIFIIFRKLLTNK